MKQNQPNKKVPIRRITISIPELLAQKMDKIIQERGFPNRSQGIADIIEEQFVESQEEQNATMAGTIILVYDASKAGLFQKIDRIERFHIPEVISSQRVLLEGDFILEVVLVQGPVQTLRKITDRLITCKGVSSGRLHLTPKLIPPVHTRY